MKKCLIFTFVYFIVTSNVHALKPLDLSKLSCNQFISVVKEINQGEKGQMRVASLTSFLYGYIAGQNNNAKFHPDELKQVLDGLKNTCKANEDQLVIDALKSAYKK